MNILIPNVASRLYELLKWVFGLKWETLYQADNASLRMSRQATDLNKRWNLVLWPTLDSFCSYMLDLFLFS